MTNKRGKPAAQSGLRTLAEVFGADNRNSYVALLRAFEAGKRPIPSWLLDALWRHRGGLKRVALPAEVERAFYIKRRMEPRQ